MVEMEESGPANEGGGNAPEERIDLGVVKRKRGRPPGSKTKNSEGGAAPRPSVSKVDPADAAFFADAFVSLVEIGDEWSKRIALAKLQKFLPAKCEEFRKLQEELGLTNPDKVMLKKTLERLASKYSIIGKFAPEILLMGLMTKITLSHLNMFRQLDKLAKSVTAPVSSAPASN